MLYGSYVNLSFKAKLTWSANTSVSLEEESREWHSTRRYATSRPIYSGVCVCVCVGGWVYVTEMIRKSGGVCMWWVKVDML